MKYTFGKTLAAQRLEILLNQNPGARRKIATLLSKYTNQLLDVMGDASPETTRLCLELLRDYTLRRIDVKSNLSYDIRSYAKNVVIYRYRVFRKNYDSLVSPMFKFPNKRKS